MKITDLFEYPITIDDNNVKDFQTYELLSKVDDQWKTVSSFKSFVIKYNDNSFIAQDTDNNPVLYLIVDFIDNNTKFPFVSYIKKFTDIALSDLIIHIYYNVLLQKYDIMYSDYQQTSKGLKIWKTLFSNKPDNVEMGIYDLRSNTHKKINNSSELTHDDHTGKYQEFKIRFYIRYDT